MFRLLAPVLLVTVLIGIPSNAAAQGGLLGALLTPLPTSGDMPSQVFSSNPFGVMFQFYNFEYEARANDTLTVGVGASRIGWRLFNPDPPKPYLNGDVFVRYYPSGRAFNGLALGLKAGMTQFHEGDRYPGIGFDINQSATVNEHVVISSGLGLKRLARSMSTPGIHVIPTFRLNLGIGF